MLIRLHRLALVAMVAVALVATGFAHRMPAPQDGALAFALANGVTLADLCGDDLAGGAAKGPACQACQIAGAADLPPLTGVQIDLELAFVARVVSPRLASAVRRVLDPSNSPQGPPVA